MASLRLNLLSCSLSARGPPRRFEYDSRVPRGYQKILPATRYGGVIRRILGGFERKGTVYFAHIDNIFDDIKEVSRAEDVRIAV